MSTQDKQPDPQSRDHISQSSNEVREIPIVVNPSSSKERQVTNSEQDKPREIGGRKGLEPTRFGDWEKNGRCIDF
jgi:hypothetical protein